MDSATNAHSTGADDAAAQRDMEARLRKERRSTRIKAGGASRLSKITGVQGNIVKEPPPAPAAATVERASPQHSAQTQHEVSRSTASGVHSHNPNTPSDDAPDPPDGDVAQCDFFGEPHHVPPSLMHNASGNLVEGSDVANPLAQMIQKLGANLAGGSGGPGEGGLFEMLNQLVEGDSNNAGAGEGRDRAGGPDPMAALLGKAGGAGGAGADLGDGLGMLGGLGGLGGLGALGGFGNMNQQQQAVKDAKGAQALNVWRVVHTTTTLALVAYFAWTTSFNGSLAQRRHSASLQLLAAQGLKSSAPHSDINDVQHHQGLAASLLHPTLDPPTSVTFFTLFMTLELCLLVSRYMVEKLSPAQWGRGNNSNKTGILWTVAALLPHPWGRYVNLALTYKGIWDTLLKDLLGVLFVLGVATWVRS